MYNESIISFPGLGIDEFVLNRVAISFKIGGHSFTVILSVLLFFAHSAISLTAQKSME